ncbi:MAG: hypothetical protein AB1603_06105 [Chloroflexota bacterium]
MDYTHAPLGEEVEFLAGSYHIEREERLPYDGREVLYLVGQTSKITSCCGVTNPFSFIKVVGYVRRWHHGTNDKGLPLSEVDMVREEREQHRIRELIHQRHQDVDLPHIEFW